MVNVHIVIPSRLGSTRLPEKPLQLIGKKTLIERVFENAKASNFSSIHIATDSDKIASEASVFCNSVILTSQHHLSGTDRINELCNIKGFDENDIIINLQGDEPFMPIEIINSMPDILNGFDIATACVPFKSIDMEREANWFDTPEIFRFNVKNFTKRFKYTATIYSVPTSKSCFISGEEKQQIHEQ